MGPSLTLAAVMSVAFKACFTAILGFAVFALTRRRPAAGMVVVICALTGGSSSIPWIKSLFLTARWGALFGACAALLVVCVARNSRIPRSLSRLDLWLACLVAVAFLSTLWSVDRRLTFERAVSFAVLIAAARLFAEVELGSGRSLERFTRAFATLAPLAVGASLVVLAVQPQEATRLNEFEGFFENPNGFGLFVALTLPYVLAFLDRRGSPRWQVTVAVALGIAATLVSASRSGLGVILIGLVVYELATRRWRRLVLHIGLIVAAAAAAFAIVSAFPSLGGSATRGAFVIHRVAGLSFVESVTGGRNEAWGATVKLIRERPIEGFGFGTGDQIFTSHPEIHFNYFEGALPENAYLQLVMEFGIPLALLFLALPVLSLVGVARTMMRGEAGAGEAATAAALAGALGALVVESVFEAAGAPWALLIWVGAVMLLRLHGIGARAAVSLPQRARIDEAYRSTRRRTGAARTSFVTGVQRMGARTNGTAGAVLGAIRLPRPSSRDRRIPAARWLVVAAVLALAALGYALTREQRAGSAPAPPAPLVLVRKNVLTVAAPFSNADVAARRISSVEGFQAGVLRALARDLDIGRVVFAKIDPQKAFAPVRRADLITGVRMTKPSSRLGLASEPYLYGHAALLELKRASTPLVRTVAQARRLRTAVYGAGLSSFLGRFGIKPVLSLDTAAAAAKALTDGRAQAVVVDWTRAAAVAKAARPERVATAGVFPSEPYVFAFVAPADRGTVYAVNRGISDLVADGTFARLQRRWFPGVADMRTFAR